MNSDWENGAPFGCPVFPAGYAERSTIKVKMKKPIKSFMVKATKAEGEEIRRSLNWVKARRGNLKIYDDHLECGNWSINYSEFQEAVVFSVRSFFLPCYVLRIKANGEIYQFGLNPNSFWKGDLPFEAKREKESIKYSPFSIIVRVIAVGYIAYLLWDKYLN